MQYTRKQIIEYITNHHTATVPELSAGLSLTITNIRHHVKELESQGILEEIGTLPGDGRGRPTKQYGLQKRFLEHNTFELTMTLLKMVVDTQTPSDVNKLEIYHSIAKELIGSYEQQPTQINRLNQAILWLNNHKHRARWEAAPHGPRIIFEQCPYRVIQDQFPDICRLGIALISVLTGFDQQQITFTQFALPGSNHCIFELNQVT